MTKRREICCVVFVLALCIISAVDGAETVETMEDAMERMMKFGYLDVLKEGAARNSKTIEEAFRIFQMFAGIEQTGKYDNETKRMMNEPRCGVSDFMGYNDARRKRRFVASNRWASDSLTYRIDSYTNDNIPEATQDEILARAFQYWSDNSGISFTRVYAPTAANIRINAYTGTTDHGDGFPFDGPGSTLAHAFFPPSASNVQTDIFFGDLHFDDDEVFVETGGSNVYNMLQVATHEVGHSLGLGHSTFTAQGDAAVMAPFYQAYDPAFDLHQDDIDGIQYLYGETSAASIAPPVTPKPGDEVPPVCDGTFDAIMTVYDAASFSIIAYAFRDTYIYKIGPTGLMSGYPRQTALEFPSLPTECLRVDAALSLFYRTENGVYGRYNYLFSGSVYCQLFNEDVVVDGYPKLIRDGWPGIPDNLDAAFEWSRNGRIYFVKGADYYRWSDVYMKTDAAYPRPLSDWNGLPSRINAALQLNYRTYFFANDQYYRFNDYTFQVYGSYPRDVSIYWLRCSANFVAYQGTDAPKTTAGSSLLVPSASVISIGLIQLFMSGILI